MIGHKKIPKVLQMPGRIAAFAEANSNPVCSLQVILRGRYPNPWRKRFVPHEADAVHYVDAKPQEYPIRRKNFRGSQESRKSDDRFVMRREN